MKKLLALILSICLVLGCMAFASAETKTGSAQGFASEVKVTAEVEDGKIVSLEVDDSGESYPVAREDSVEKVIAAILENGNAEGVDASTGATFTCKAVIEAVNGILAGGEEAPAADAPLAFTAGDYEVTTDGYNGPVTFKVTFSDAALTGIEVTSSMETAHVGTPAFDIMIADMLEANGSGVDGVSGATFSGRALHPSEDNPKYLNNSESVTYTKGSVLFGMNFAFRHIRSADMSVLVEGNADVVKMHQLGVCNVVATCGTSLTDEQIRQLGKASKNITLMLDGDEPGQKATDKNGRRLVESGLYVYVLTIPKAEDGSKQDPDSFFTSKEHFEEFKAEHSKMFLVALAESKKEACVNDPMTRARTVKDIARLFADRDPAERGELANLLAQTIPGKTLWKDTIKQIDDEKRRKAKLDKDNARMSLKGKTQEQEELIRKYGFYIENNCYWFYSLKGDSFFKGSNFTMEPLFHIVSTINAKRLYRLKNVYGKSEVLEFSQKDLISIAAFRLRCESLGNFLFEGGDHGLNKIKAYLYDNTKTCREVTQLGWQKQGFFAWSNGITVDGEFRPLGELGVVEHEGQHYYIPALSSFYKEEDTLFQFERKFVHRAGDISLFDFTDKLMKVYGDNAIAGIGFYFATLFRDIIIAQHRFFPILNIFGPKGTGKSEMARGHQHDQQHRARDGRPCGTYTKHAVPYRRVQELP